MSIDRERWKQLLKDERLHEDEFGKGEHAKGRNEYERDHDRVVFTGAFRRLQDKTQVYPFSPTDYTRTRLTHTLEVACAGRSLGTLLGKWLNEDEALVEQSDIGTLVTAACLAHDIGNPPFGHAGEIAIRKGFSEFCENNPGKVNISEDEKKDFERFEGNAQGFRILTRFYSRERKGGIRPTYALVGAFSKYPCASSVAADNKDVSKKKFGFFQDDREMASKSFRALGMINRGENEYARHPIAFLMEAADDVCYSVADLEDAFKMRLISFSEAIDLLKNASPQYGDDEELEEHSRVARMRALAINSLVLSCWDEFRENAEAIQNGEHKLSLIEGCKLRDQALRLKDATRNRAQINREVLLVEAAGAKALKGLLEIFLDVVLSGGKDAEQGKLR